MPSSMATFAMLLLLFLFFGSSNAQLSTNYYSKSCPHVFPAIRSVVALAIKNETRMGSSLLRLFFHDCFVNGCDGSLLLDDNKTFTGEKNAQPNKNSARGFNVIDNIKSKVEKVCPGVVSCADIIAIAARDSVVILGGPSWKVKLGRKDARSASQAAANNSIPAPFFNLTNLTASFQAQGLSIKEMVALSGAHTIGQVRCTNYKNHTYNDTNIDSFFAETMKAKCPRASGPADNNTAPLDLQTPNAFDNHFYQNLVKKKSLLHSDQELFNGGPADFFVKTYSNDAITFYKDFVAAMIKMGDIKPLTGSSGEVRKNCRKVN